MTDLTDILADQLHTERTRAMQARAALSFIRGVLDTCQRFGQPLTAGLLRAMLKECNDVLEPTGSTETVV